MESRYRIFVFLLITLVLTVIGHTVATSGQDLTKKSLRSLKKGEFKRALRLSKRAFRRNPNNGRVAYRLGRMLFETDQYHDSIEILRRLINRSDNSELPARVFTTLSASYLKENQYGKAFKYLVGGLKISRSLDWNFDPLYKIFRHERFSSNERTKFLEAGRNYLQPQFIMEFCRLSSMSKKFFLAKQILKKWIKKQSKPMKFRKIYSGCLIENGSYRQALEQLQAIEFRNKNLQPEIIYRFSKTHFELKNYRKSLQYAGKLLRSSYEKPKLYTIVGGSLRAVGNHKESLKFLLRSIRSDPYSSRSHIELAKLFQDVGQVQKAIDTYRKSTLFQYQNAPVYKQMGKLYLHQKKNPLLASYYFRLATTLNPKLNKATKNLKQVREETRKQYN